MGQVETMATGADFTIRPPTMDDLHGVLAAIVACNIEELGQPDYTEDELRGDWQGHDLEQDAWVAVTLGGEIAGYAILSQRAHVRLDGNSYVHPAHRGRGLEGRLLDAVEGRARQHIPLAPPGARVTLNHHAASTATATGRLLTGRGYAVVRHEWRMVIGLDEPPPAPAWPEGLAARAFVPGGDDRAVYDAVQDAFQDMWGHVPPSFEDWRAFMLGREDLDPTLWTLARDGDAIAGVALCYHFSDMGWVRTLAVRRPWRGRGLGLALLRHTFGEFYRRGQRTVALGVDAESPTGATRLYRRAGMRPTLQFDQYQKELRPGVE